MEKTGCKIICSALTTFAVKGLMMMIMMANPTCGIMMAKPINGIMMTKAAYRIRLASLIHGIMITKPTYYGGVIASPV